MIPSERRSSSARRRRRRDGAGRGDLHLRGRRRQDQRSVQAGPHRRREEQVLQVQEVIFARGKAAEVNESSPRVRQEQRLCAGCMFLSGYQNIFTAKIICFRRHWSMSPLPSSYDQGETPG